MPKGGGGERMNTIYKQLIECLCKLAESSLHNVSIRGNYQKDVRALKEAVETKEEK